MADEALDFAQKVHAQNLEERKQLVDAARESARTFDKAVLTFGSAVFGFSIVFLKDIAPKPAPQTLKWLGASWLLFSIGLLLILLSFLFSHRACLFQIESLNSSSHQHKKNQWSTITHWCNFSCIVLLFFGLLCWSVFAFDNLSIGDTSMNKDQPAIEKYGYVPPAPPKAPPQQQAPTQPATPPQPTPKQGDKK